MKLSPRVVKAIGLTAEICNTELPTDIMRVWCYHLSMYDEDQVIRALYRCQREIKHRLTPADIIERITDGRPSADEAWGMLPTSEAQSVVWTEEIAAAYGETCDMSDRVAARRSFIDTYNRLVAEARERGEKPKWSPSYGTDPGLREAAVERAVRLGRLPAVEIKQLPTQAVSAPALQPISKSAIDGAIELLGQCGIEIPEEILEEIK